MTEPNLRRLQLGWTAFFLVDTLSTVALSVWAFDHGGASAVGVVGLARLLPGAIALPFGAWAADRFPRRACGHGGVRRDRGQSGADRDRVGIGCPRRRGVRPRRGEQCRRHPVSVGPTGVGAARRANTVGAGGDERDGGNARRSGHVRRSGSSGAAVARGGPVGGCRRRRGRGGSRLHLGRQRPSRCRSLEGGAAHARPSTRGPDRWSHGVAQEHRRGRLSSAASSPNSWCAGSSPCCWSRCRSICSNSVTAESDGCWRSSASAASSAASPRSCSLVADDSVARSPWRSACGACRSQ